MKYYPTLLVMLLMATSARAVNPAVYSNETTAPMALQLEGQYVSLEELVNNKPRHLAKKYGVKLSLKERIGLSIVRSKLKKAKRKGVDLTTAYEEAAGSSNFHFGGFILGFFLGLLGWLLAILIWPNMGAGRSALLGLAIWLIVVLLFVA